MLGDYKRLVEAPMIRDYEDQIAALRAEIERLTTPSQGLDAATVERCAQVAADMHGADWLGVNKERWKNTQEVAAAIRALATDPHQHGGKANG